MTNREESIDIVAKMPNTFKVDFAEKCCIEMAKRKDQQFKEYLEKFIFQCEMTARTVVAYDLDAAGRNKNYAECARIIINELFKEG